MKKIKILIPGDKFVTNVQNLCDILHLSHVAARVERNEESNEDYLLLTFAPETSDEVLVKTGMLIQKHLN